jgi:hypothetical protein
MFKVWDTLAPTYEVKYLKKSRITTTVYLYNILRIHS